MLTSTDLFDAPRLATLSGVPRFMVVASSGGGLTSLRELFRAVPRSAGMSFLVAQHLPEDHSGLLREFLVQWARPEIRFVDGDCPIEENTVYVLSSRGEAIVRDGWVLTLPARSRWERHPSLDDLFGSVAESHPDRGVGVLLSGNGRDGVAGLARLEAAGGTIVVQDPKTASRVELPQAALDATSDPWVLPPELIFGVVQAVVAGRSRAEIDADLEHAAEARTLTVSERTYQLEQIVRAIDRRF